MKLDTVYGIHAVTAFLNNRAAQVKTVLFSDKRNDPRLDTLRRLADSCNVPCEDLAAREFQHRFDQWKHQGVVALCQPAEPMTEPQMLEMLAGLEKPALVLALDQITDPHNFGAVLRTADAAGVDCVLLPRNGSVGMTPVVRKVASGAAETIPVCRVTNLARSLGELKSLGLWLYGAAGEAGAVGYNTVDLSASVGIVMGAEGSGLRRLSRQACDQLISIPMAGSVESLNVSVATGICLYEAVRQRGIEKMS